MRFFSINEVLKLNLHHVRKKLTQLVHEFGNVAVVKICYPKITKNPVETEKANGFMLSE